MGQFTRSIGHEILWFTVTVISLSDERCLYERMKWCHSVSNVCALRNIVFLGKNRIGKNQ